MNNLLKNITSLIRGNLLCAKNKIFSNIVYHPYIRIFGKASICVNRKGNLIINKGVTIGARNICVVRNGANMELGKMVSFNSDCKIVCHKHIEIGDNTIFGPNVLVYDHDHIYDLEKGVDRKRFNSSPIIIGKNCWIGANTIILRGTIIGDNSIIGAGSVIKGEFPKGSKIIQKREYIDFR